MCHCSGKCLDYIRRSRTARALSWSESDGTGRDWRCLHRFPKSCQTTHLHKFVRQHRHSRKLIATDDARAAHDKSRTSKPLLSRRAITSGLKVGPAKYGSSVGTPHCAHTHGEHQNGEIENIAAALCVTIVVEEDLQSFSPRWIRRWHSTNDLYSCVGRVELERASEHDMIHPTERAAPTDGDKDGQRW